MVMNMARNFSGMLLLLKILTVATLAVPAFCTHSLFSPTVNVFGTELAVSEWTASGAGFVSLAISRLVVAAGATRETAMGKSDLRRSYPLSANRP